MRDLLNQLLSVFTVAELLQLLKQLWFDAHLRQLVASSLRYAMLVLHEFV